MDIGRENMKELKERYNYILKRYYNGCNYIEEHPEQFDKYFDKIMEFKNEIEKILDEIQKTEKVSEEDILGGFKIC